MFSKISERTMHRTRWVLIVGWLVLIASLFYDPVSAYLTQPETWSPFRIRTPGASFQGESRDQIPYPMGARIFWGMVVPFVVLLLVTFGHEAWRRICPLSFVSQIPRALGRQRKRRVLNPETNTVQYELAFIDPESWLGRNQLYVQCGLLFLGLNIRLWLVNSDRLMLGVFLTFTLLSAIAVGWLYGGKTWCQYFCPMAPVQMIYTGPRGFLGSKAYTTQQKGISQSMCRTVDVNGQEKSACVSCQSPCIDIDAERAYWDAIQHPSRTVMYYGYLGLAIGFYLYFFLYSGDWNFLSGSVWQETNQLQTLGQPGFFMGQVISIPKVIAVPLTLLTFSGGTYGLGLGLERWYIHYLGQHHKPIQLGKIRHRLFTIYGFLAFNSLYFLGVHPTLVWLDPFRPLVAWGAVMISSMWLYRTLRRSADQYLRDSLTQLLRRQLSKLNLDFRQSLGDRTLDDLKPDEVYVLAKVLPGFSRDQRLTTYQEVLKEALENGNVNSSSSLEVLQQIREQLGITAQEHQSILTTLGVTQPSILDPQQQLSREQRLRLSSYRQALELLLLELIQQGTPLQDALEQKQGQIRILRQEYRISGAEDAQVLAQLSGQNSVLMRAADALLDQLQTLAKRSFALTQASERTLDQNDTKLLWHILQSCVIQQQQLVSQQILSVLEILGDQSDAHRIAQACHTLVPETLQTLLGGSNERWNSRLSPTILKIICAPSGDRPALGHFPLSELLREFLSDLDPVVQAASLSALWRLDPQQAILQAQSLQVSLLQTTESNTVLQETIDQILKSKPQNSPSTVLFTLEIQVNGQCDRRNFNQTSLRIGRDGSNDLVLEDGQVSRRHAQLTWDGSQVNIEDLGSSAGLRISDRFIRNGHVVLNPGDQVWLNPDLTTGIKVFWEANPGTGSSPLGETTTLEKILKLLNISLFKPLTFKQLTQLAQTAQLQTYESGAVLCRQHEPSQGWLILIHGAADAFINAGHESQRVGKLMPGETMGGLGLASSRSTTVITTEPSQVLFIPSAQVENLLGQDASVAVQILKLLSDRLQHAWDESSYRYNL